MEKARDGWNSRYKLGKEGESRDVFGIIYYIFANLFCKSNKKSREMKI
jgi:hypothetical protein